MTVCRTPNTWNGEDVTTCTVHGGRWPAGTPTCDAAPAPMPLRPLVLVDITEGVEQWTAAYPGEGAPIVEVYDFDHERDDDDAADMVATLERWHILIASRESDDAADEAIGAELDYWRFRVRVNEAEEAARRVLAAATLADV